MLRKATRERPSQSLSFAQDGLCERGWVKVKNRAYCRYELAAEGAIRGRHMAGDVPPLHVDKSAISIPEALE
jgi:hypothetical protein